MPWKRAPSCATGPHTNPSILADWTEIVKPKVMAAVKTNSLILSISGTKCFNFRLVYWKRLNFSRTPSAEYAHLERPRPGHFSRDEKQWPAGRAQRHFYKRAGSHCPGDTPFP